MRAILFARSTCQHTRLLLTCTLKPVQCRAYGGIVNYSPGGKKVHRARSGSSCAAAPGSVCSLIIFYRRGCNNLSSVCITKVAIFPRTKAQRARRSLNYRNVPWCSLCLCAKHNRLTTLNVSKDMAALERFGASALLTHPPASAGGAANLIFRSLLLDS